MNIAIIDDSYLDRKYTRDFLFTYFSDHCSDVPFIIRTFNSGEDFLYTFTRDTYDFIFTDYYMKKLSGLETAKIIRATDKQVVLIFTTVSRDYAIDCYQVKASGYLVKPFSYQELSDVLALADLEQIKAHEYIELSNGLEKVKIVVKDILHCDISGHYTNIYTKTAGVKRIRTSFSALAVLLAPFPEFISCYRGCLINMDYIVKLEENAFLMVDNSSIPFRKNEQSKMAALYSEYLFDKVRNNKK